MIGQSSDDFFISRSLYCYRDGKIDVSTQSRIGGEPIRLRVVPDREEDYSRDLEDAMEIIGWISRTLEGIRPRSQFGAYLP
jgi:hypothetical protein